jgi:gas vesicle protein
MSTVDKLLIGVAAGAILGVLYAPGKGSETRRKLACAGRDLRDRFNNLKDTISDKIDNMKGQEEIDGISYQEREILDRDASVNPVTWQ